MAIANILSTNVQNPVEKDLKDFSLSDSLGLFQRSGSNDNAERVGDKQFRLYSEKLDDKLNKIVELMVPTKKKERSFDQSALTDGMKSISGFGLLSSIVGKDNKGEGGFGWWTKLLGSLAGIGALYPVIRGISNRLKTLPKPSVKGKTLVPRATTVTPRPASPTTSVKPGTPERAPVYDERAKRFRDPQTGRFMKAPKEALDTAVKNKIPKLLSGLGPKALPFGIGAAVGSIFGTLRWLEGDKVGAALEVAVGASAAIPAVGVAAAIMGTVALAGRDIYNELYGDESNRLPFDNDMIKNPDLIAERMPEITEEVKRMVQEALRARELTKEETEAILESVKKGGKLDAKTRALVGRNKELRETIDQIRSDMQQEMKKYGVTSTSEVLQKREEERQQQQRVLQQQIPQKEELGQEGMGVPEFAPAEIMNEPPPEQPDMSEQQPVITPIIMNNTTQTVINRRSSRGSIKTPWLQAVEG
jgi:hypothetical protein